MIHLKEKGDNVRTLLDSVSSFVLVGGQELSILGEAAELVWDAWRELVSLETWLSCDYRPEAEPGVRRRTQQAKKGSHFLYSAPLPASQTLTALIMSSSELLL